jgi:hypothetical protein
MKYRCTKCNHANERKPGLVKGKLFITPCDNCGDKDIVRAERAHIIQKDEVYRSGSQLFTLNKSNKKFELYGK